MKLWDSLTTCLVLLGAVHASLIRQQSAKRKGSAAEDPLELPPVQMRPAVFAQAVTVDWEETLAGDRKDTIEEPPLREFEDVVAFIKQTVSRIRRSSSPTVVSSASTTSSPPTEHQSGRTRQRREKQKGASQQGGKGGREGARRGEKVRGGRGGQGCVLKQIHLNVSDLGLGYRSSEEMIFKYCSGLCRKSETNYDKILHNLASNRRLPPKDTPPQACCRPIAFDDDLSFLDDNLVYHTVRKHSARKCGCV